MLQLILLLKKKRNVLSATASLYNPIGYIQTITIKLKLLFQESCLMNVSLDEVNREQLLQTWILITESLKNMY